MKKEPAALFVLFICFLLGMYVLAYYGLKSTKLPEPKALVLDDGTRSWKFCDGDTGVYIFKEPSGKYKTYFWPKAPSCEAR